MRQDIIRQLGMRDPRITVTGFARPNLRFEVDFASTQGFDPSENEKPAQMCREVVPVGNI